MALSAKFDADFGTFVSELMKVDVTLRKFDATADKSATKLEKMANALQGNKIAEQAAVAVAAIGKIEGGVAALTDKELKRYGAAIDEATEKFTRMGRQVPADMANVKTALDAARTQAEALSKAAPSGDFAAGMVGQTEKVAGGFGAMKTASIGAIAGIASSLTTMGVSALKDFALEALATGGKVADLAAKTGLTTTEVQTFSYAAEQAGASMETVTGAVTQLNNRLSEGGDSTTAALKDVGLTLGNLAAMEPGAAFNTVAEAIAKIPDPMKQTQVAMDLFGKSGAELLPAIKGGFTDTAAEASRLGLVIHEDSIKALDDMGDAWDRMALKSKVAFANIFANLAGSFKGALAQIKSDVDTAFKVAVQGSASMFAGMGPFGNLAATAFRTYMGPMNEGDLAALGAATAKGDIMLEGPKPAPAVVPTPPKVDKAAEAAAKKWADEINALTGADKVAAAERLAKQINSIGASNIPAQNIKALADQLMRAKAIGDPTGTIGAALNELPIQSQRVAVNMLTVQGSISGAARTAEVLSDKIRGSNQAMTGLITSTNPLTANLLKLPQAVEGTKVKVTQVTAATHDWTGAVQEAAQAFATLAQNIGGTTANVAQLAGGFFSAMSAGTAFSKAIGSALFGEKGFGDTGAKGKAGAALGMGMAGFSVGGQFGYMAGSKGKGALAGAASGAATGAMMGMVGGPIGAGMGAVIGGAAGLIGGWLGGAKKEKEAIAALQEHKTQLLAMFGTRENLIEQAKRIGMSESEVTTKILNNTKNTKAYEEATTKLSDALEKEKKQAEALTKELDKVAAVNGVLSRQQMQDTRAALAVGGGPRTEAAQAFIDQQVGSLMQGLQGALDSGPLSAGLVASIGESLPAVFAELTRQGMSSIDALKQMAPLLESFQQNAVLAGAGSTPGFDALNAQLGILKDEKLGPMIEQAGFASQAMAALNNTGWLTQQTFEGFAGTITTAFQAMIDGGASGDNALAMLHQPLQNVWQLVKDFGYEVDDATKALLDQAEAAGTIGDKFRPAEDRMASAMDKVVERLDHMIGIFTGDLVEGAQGGAEAAGKAITDTFAAIRPRIIIEYEYQQTGTPPTGPGLPPTTPAPPPGGTNAAQRATQGAGGPGDVYLDGDRVGYHVARRLDDIAAMVG